MSLSWCPVWGCPVVVAVSDILSFGRDARPGEGGGNWRWSWPASPPPRPRLSSGIYQARDNTAGNPHPLPHRSATPSAPPTRPARMTGQPLPPDASLSLLLGGHGPAWLRVATGHAEPVRGLPSSGNGYQFIRIAGGWAAQPFPVDPGATTAPPDRCRFTTWQMETGREPSRRRRLRRPGAPRCPVASQIPAWRGHEDRGRAPRRISASPAPRSGPGSGCQPDTGSTREPSPGCCWRRHGGPGPVRDELWDPATGQEGAPCVNLIATGPAEIAWMPGCTTDCRVHGWTWPGWSRNDSCRAEHRLRRRLQSGRTAPRPASGPLGTRRLARRPRPGSWSRPSRAGG